MSRSRLPVLRLRKEIAVHLRRGQPWIYRDALEPVRAHLPAGAIVDVADRRGAFVARGFWDPDAPIAVRVLARDPEETIDEAWVRARVASACAIRRAAAAQIDSDAVRLIHGEGDFLPGLVLDAYAQTGVARFDGEGAAALWRPRIAEIVTACAEAGFPLARVWGRPAGEVFWGDAPSHPIVVREGNARYEVDVVHGQKTGFFLDQRDNRRLVGRLAAGASVLNLFAYTGGFSVAAALGGAQRVTTVDSAAPAIEAARRNLWRNGIPLEAHELVVADAFEFLAKARREGRSWDIVVCDPPSFAPSERAKPRALSAYRRLNRDAAQVVARGGILATASCSSHVSHEEFLAAIAAGLGDVGRTGRVVEQRGAGPDHPVPPGFPEGRYLKFVLVAL